MSRGTLRSLLGRYLYTDPRTIRFRCGVHGKLALDVDGTPSLRFNLAHSGEICVIALGHDVELGIDVELIRRDVDPLEIARYAFSHTESSALRAIPEALRLQVFYAGWTRKEAFVKALGLGLLMPLDGFSVSLSPWEPAALVEVAGDPKEAARWILCPFSAGPLYPGTVALPTSSKLVRWFNV